MVEDINFKDVLNDSLYGTGIIDMNGMLLYVNQEWADIHGLSVEDSIGKHMSSFYSQEYIETMDRLNKELLEKGRLPSEKTLCKRKNGTTFPALISAFVVKNESKKPSYISTVVQDITNLVKEENVAYWNALRVLSGGISHDFNNILMGILGHCTIAKKKLSENNPASQNLENILTASRRASNVIQHLQRLAGKKNITIESVKICSIFDVFAKSLDVSVPFNVEIRCNTEKCDGTILVDISQINQILQSLLTNSIHAVEKANREKGLIKLSAENIYFDGETLAAGKYPKGNYAKLEFYDNGCGMNEETIKQVFIPFFTTKKDTDNAMGLGMSIVYGIVAKYNGFIDIESKEEEEETSVYIYLPYENFL